MLLPEQRKCSDVSCSDRSDCNCTIRVSADRCTVSGVVSESCITYIHIDLPNGGGSGGESGDQSGARLGNIDLQASN